MQSQLVCNGCRSILLYPRGATNVCCALCSTITSVPSPAYAGADMAQLICGGCRTLLMYTRGATSVRCSCCHTVNLAPVTPASNQYAHVNCGNCRTMLMYPSGAPSVKCAICQFITNVGAGNPRVSVPPQRIDGPPSGTTPSSSTSMPQSTQTVVVENPMSVDESGKLVTNVVVGVTTEKR